MSDNPYRAIEKVGSAPNWRQFRRDLGFCLLIVAFGVAVAFLIRLGRHAAAERERQAQIWYAYKEDAHCKWSGSTTITSTTHCGGYLNTSCSSTDTTWYEWKVKADAITRQI